MTQDTTEICNLSDEGCAWEICTHYGGASHLCSEASPLCKKEGKPMAWKIKTPFKKQNKKGIINE